MPDYISIVLLPNLLQTLSAIAPKISVIVHALNHIDSISKFEDLNLDFAIGMYSNAPDHLIKQKLFSDEAVYVCCAHNKHIRKEMSLNEWLEYPHVLIGYQPNFESIYINKIIEKNGGTLKPAAILPYTLAILHLLPNSNFVTIVPKRLAEIYSKLLNLKRFELPFPMKPYRASHYWHEKNHHSTQHIWMRNIILTQSQNIPDLLATENPLNSSILLHTRAEKTFWDKQL